MSSATARAEARRKALRERGTDRLAKLTTSARGEDSPVYQPTEKPLPNPTSNLKNFVGEETHLPPPPASHRPEPSSSSAAADPSVWSQEQQMEFMRALMGAGLGSLDPSNPNQLRSTPSITSASASSPLQQPDDPVAALMSSFSQINPQAGSSSGPGEQSAIPNPFAAFQPPSTTPPSPPSALHKVIPLIHILTTWCLLAYYVLFAEPQAYAAQPASISSTSQWTRWADLAWRRSGVVQFVPLFFMFMTVQVVLHSWRVFSGFDQIQPPTLLALALPQLPKPLPSLILNGMKYIQLGSALLDDLAALIFGLGLTVWIATWLSG